VALADALRAKSNPIPFSERMTCTITEASQLTGIGRRKFSELIAQRRLETLKLDGRRLIVASSLLNLLNAGADAPLVEPPQLKQAREGGR
jgi:excisionase family DNA binding protein